jgi:hypothetical protein
MNEIKKKRKIVVLDVHNSSFKPRIKFLPAKRGKDNGKIRTR